MRKLIGGLIAVVIILGIVSLFVLRTVHVGANERGVLVGVSGVNQEPVQPGLAWYCPATTTFHVANVGQQKFTMDNTPPEDDKYAFGRPKDEQVFTSSDNQPVHVAIAVLWHRDPLKVVSQLMSPGKLEDDHYFTEVVLRTPIILETKNAITTMTAIDAYSGITHVKAQAAVFKALQDNKDLIDKGAVIEAYTMEVTLDPDYMKSIQERQIAILQKQAYDEQAKAADANALLSKAKAQADANTQIVAAERDKQIALLKAEQQQQTVELSAKAQANQTVIQAQGEKEAAQNRADAVLAEGRAKAESQKLLFTAYAAPGADMYVSTIRAQYLAQAFSGVKGFIPAGMNINTFATDFDKAVGIVVAPPAKGQ